MQQRNDLRRWSTWLIILSLVTSSPLASLPDQYVGQMIVASRGTPAARMVTAWAKLIQDGRKMTPWQQINLTNTFFNRRIRYVSDQRLWGVADYWATPLEMMKKRAGDCEDYVIGKYVTLLAMGIPDSQLRLMYVRATTVNQAHMVLLYDDPEQSQPWVLDNLKPSILLANQRPDLIPVYSFNGIGLWLSHQRGRAKARTNRLTMWQDLQARMKKELSSE